MIYQLPFHLRVSRPQESEPWGHSRPKWGMVTEPFAWKDTLIAAFKEELWAPATTRRAKHHNINTQLLQCQIYQQVSTLQEHEIPWNYVSLTVEENGYMLRPRYREAWIASFGCNLYEMQRAEDAVILPVSPRARQVFVNCLKFSSADCRFTMKGTLS